MILPQFFPLIFLVYQVALYQQFAECFFADLLAHAPNNLLVKIDQHVDFAPIEKACAGYHHASGPGRPAEYSIKLLVRALLVGYVYGLSLRQLEQQLYTDLAARWFVGAVGYDGMRFASIPDHSTLARFELWVIRNCPEIFFDTVLRQVDQAFPTERCKVQVGDTYAMLAYAAKESLIVRLRHVSLRLIRELVDVLPHSGERCLTGLDWTALFGVAPEVPSDYLKKEARLERLDHTARAALDLQHRVEGLLASYSRQAYPLLRAWLGYLSKVLSDEIKFDPVPDGQVQKATELPRKDKGTFRLGSAGDPEATYRNHGGAAEDTYLGYNVQVAATTTGFIRATLADTGTTPDHAHIADLIADQIKRLGCCPTKLLYDLAAGTGKVYAEVREVSHGQTQLVSKLVDLSQRSQRFGPYDFTLSDDNKSLTCPNQRSSSIAYHFAGHANGRTFEFHAWQCWQGEPPKRMQDADLSKRCPLWEQCRDSRAGPGAKRQVFISDYRAEVLTARAYNQTETFLKEMKQRSMIERVIAEVVNYCGARRCRRRGLAKADYQAKMGAAVYNLRLWMRKVHLVG